MTEFLQHLYLLSLDAAPLLVFGLVLAGLMKAWLPESFLREQLGKPGPGSVIKAAFLGAPMPLCSCGVLPVALNLRRSGASKGATVSFLVSTPETGVDSISLSYALLGPVLTIARPIAAVTNAISAGLLTGWQEARQSPAPTATEAHCSSQEKSQTSSCCAPKQETSCCDSKTEQKAAGWRSNLNYTFGQLLDDMLPWLSVGLLFAAAVQTFVPADWLAEWGKGPLAMLVMVVIGIPMYICASASTPIAAGLLLAGVSPGTVLVFLLAGPATNIAAVGLIHKELGRRALLSYLSTVAVVSIGSGLLLDYLIGMYQWEIVAASAQHTTLLPTWLAVSSLLLLVVAGIRPLRRNSLERLLAA